MGGGPSASLKDLLSSECKNNTLLASYEEKISQYETIDMQEALLKIANQSDSSLKPQILDIGVRAGDTDYIDFILPTEMTSCIMYGKDRHQREFVSYLLHFEPISNPTDSPSVKQYKKAFDNVITLFKRYSDAERWTHAISHGKEVRVEIFETSTDKMEFLAKTGMLCAGKEIIITSGEDYEPEWIVTLQKILPQEQEVEKVL